MSYQANRLTDVNDLGFFANPAALNAAYPVGAPGYFAIVGSTDTIWVWDSDTNTWVDTGSGGGGIAIGDPITSATAGSVLFAGTSGVLQQDNANFFWDNTNKELGIGTNAPDRTLQIKRLDSAASTNLYLLNLYRDSVGGAANRGTGISFRDLNTWQANIVALRTNSSSDFRSDLVFFTNNNSAAASEAACTEWARLTSGGNFGIGTGATVSAKLHVVDPANNFQIRTGSTGAFNYDIGRNGSTGILTFFGNQTGATGYIFSGVDGERMRIDTSGNISVGRTTTTEKFEVYSTVAGRGLRVDGAGGGSYLWLAGGNQTLSTVDKAGIVVANGNFGRGNMYFLVDGSTDGNDANITDDTRMMIDFATGNIGIATLTPGARLTVGAGQVAVPLGTVTAPSYAFDGDLNTGMWSPGADTIAWSTAGSERARIDLNGNLLVGATASSGRTTIYGNNNVPLISIGSASVSRYDFTRDGTTGALSVQGNQAGFNNIILAPTSGSVGIGVAAPTAVLHLKAGAATASNAPLKFTAGAVLTTPEAGTMEFTNSETGLTFTAIGTRRQVILDTAAQTLTNKRIQPRTSTSASGDITPDLATANVWQRTAQAAAITINAPTGTPVLGEVLVFMILDNGTGRAITWNSAFTTRVMSAALPTTTTASKQLLVTCQFNGTTWLCLSSEQI